MPKYKKPIDPKKPKASWLPQDDLIKEAFFHAIERLEEKVYNLKDSEDPRDVNSRETAQSLVNQFKSYWERRHWGW